jgi:hypothetical protein
MGLRGFTHLAVVGETNYPLKPLWSQGVQGGAGRQLPSLLAGFVQLSTEPERVPAQRLQCIRPNNTSGHHYKPIDLPGSESHAACYQLQTITGIDLHAKAGPGRFQIL